MTRAWLRLAELATYAVITLALLALAAYMVAMDRTGEAFGAVLGTVPVLVQAIGRIGQSQAMQAMADYLAQSQPAVPPPEKEP